MRKLVNTILAGVLGLSMIAGVSAQEVEDSDSGPAVVEVGINESGTLDVVIEEADFGLVPYSLQDQEAEADNIVVTVVDDRGSNAGWNVVLTGTNFSTEGDSPLTFPVTNLVLGDGAVTPEVGSATGIQTTGGAVQTESETSAISAESGTGTGRFNISFEDSTLTVPGGTLVGDYSSTLQVEISSAP